MKYAIFSFNGLIFLLVGTLFGQLAWAESATGLIFEDTFKRGLGDHWKHSGNKHTKTIVDPQDPANGQLKFTLDRLKDKVPFRSELVIKKPRRIFRFGQDHWIGVRIFLPDDWEVSQYIDILLQWHSVPDTHLGESWKNGLNPPLALFVNGERWRLTSLWDANRITQKRKYSGSNRYDLGPIARGQWTDWVIRVTWSYTPGKGILEVWRDGKQVVSQPGPNTFNDRKPPYLKLGIYKPAWNPKNKWAEPTLASRTVYFSNLRIAGSDGSYETVAPAGGARPPMARHDVKTGP